MKPFENLSPGDFTYILPEDRIALFPLDARDASKLLIRKQDGTLNQDVFSNLADYLVPESHMFFNNSKVIPARLLFTKGTGSRIEIFCLKPEDPSDYALSLSANTSCTWECMVGNLKRFNSHSLSLDLIINDFELKLIAEKIIVNGNIAVIKFTWNNGMVTFADILSQAGQTPLPPYIKREPVPNDRERYQTIYSRFSGSVAAPTAGLHFTSEVFRNIAEKRITCHEVTLHVGAGTFQPVKAELIRDHEMHPEYFEITPSLVAQLAELPGSVTCVGTTTVRTLESLYWSGVKLLTADKNSLFVPGIDQWEAYFLPQNYSMKEAFEALARWFDHHKVSSIMASTKLMIVPGYKFHVADTLITNFHQPGSTLLLLIAAFIGDSWKETYEYALGNGFRFLSYGDSSLLFRPENV